MAITYSTYFDYSSSNAFGTVTTPTLTILNSDIVVVAVMLTDSNPAGNLSISNSGTAMTWSLIGDVNVASRCRVAAWWAKSAGNENRTATVTWDSGNNLNWGLFAAVHTGAHQTTPVPVGNVFSGSAASSVTQSITPTGTGSALWMVSANGATVNATTYTAGANCTIDRTAQTDQWDAILLRPTTQPRTNGSAFTLAETHTGSAVSWLAFEVQAAASGPSIGAVMHNRRMHGMS